MTLLPFLFFSALTGYWWYRHGRLDICVYMSGLYALTSLLAIVIVQGKLLGEGGILYDNDTVQIGLIPTLLYCGCIGLCLLPFSMVYGRDVERITIHAPWAVDLMSLMLIAVSFLNLYLVADSTLDILQGDLGQLRMDHYEGAETPAQLKAETMPFLLRFFYYFNPSTVLCLPVLFFNICFRKKAWWWNALLLFASLSCPLAGIQTADRTEIVYWGLQLGLLILFFYPFFSRRTKWGMAAVGVPILAAALVYFVAVSQSRFDRQGASDSGDRTVQYTGQNFINFCYFYEKGNDDYLSPEREFPLLNHYLYHRHSDADRRDERAGELGFFMSVFASFIGDIMLDLGLVGMLVWVVCFFLCVMLLLRSSHRDVFDISEFLLLYLLAIIPVFGIFYYRFFSFSNTYTFLLVIALLLVSKYKILLK